MPIQVLQTPNLWVSLLYTSLRDHENMAFLEQIRVTGWALRWELDKLVIWVTLPLTHSSQVPLLKQQPIILFFWSSTLLSYNWGSPTPISLSSGAQGLNSLVKWTCVCVLSHFSHVRLSATLLTIACQAPLSMRFSRHEYWSGLPFPTPGDFPDPGIKLASLMSPALAGGVPYH